MTSTSALIILAWSYKIHLKIDFPVPFLFREEQGATPKSAADTAENGEVPVVSRAASPTSAEKDILVRKLLQLDVWDIWFNVDKMFLFCNPDWNLAICLKGLNLERNQFYQRNCNFISNLTQPFAFQDNSFEANDLLSHLFMQVQSLHSIDDEKALQI